MRVGTTRPRGGGAPISATSSCTNTLCFLTLVIGSMSGKMAPMAVTPPSASIAPPSSDDIVVLVRTVKNMRFLGNKMLKLQMKVPQDCADLSQTPDNKISTESIQKGGGAASETGEKSWDWASRKSTERMEWIIWLDIQSNGLLCKNNYFVCTDG
ncbi:hypothetical protein OIU85_010767 [Salix viminalis]|uniref:Uncharacterized protein n=1 Tax=Salix viminalis TaxID=40686 RepID=A0A9Q0SEW5_SALVM|nr:hypothetical protein OIU85_010767 [Salix viminalis]